MNGPSASPGQIDFAAWLLRLFTWDGVLPVCVLVAPSLVEIVLPNRRGAIEIIAVTLPIAGFFARVVAGTRHIGSNNCGPLLRQLQYSILFLSVFALVFVANVILLLKT